MELAYIFIRNLRNFNNQGINLSSRFNFDYNIEENKLNVKENSFHLDDFYSSNINNLKCIVGQNGAGKTSILTYLKEILTSPITRDRTEDIQMFLVLANEDYSSLRIVQNTFNISKRDVISEHKFDISTKNLSEYTDSKTLTFDESSDSVLRLIDEFEPSTFLFLSNTFDGHSESSYWPAKTPFSVSLSTNHLVLNHTEYGGVATYKANEILKNIKLTLAAKEYLPELKFPTYIRLRIAHAVIPNQRPEMPEKKDKYSKQKLDLIKGYERSKNIVAHVKKAFFEYNEPELLWHEWLYGYMIHHVGHFMRDEQEASLLKAIENPGMLGPKESIKGWFLNNARKLRKVRKIGNESITIDWENYFQVMLPLIDLVIVQKESNTNDNKDQSSILIELNEANEDLISQLIKDSQVTKDLGPNIFRFDWRDMSTGENMILRLFSNLYYFKQEFCPIEGIKDTKLYFLLDEIETYFHPQWQKRIVKILIDFITKFFDEFKVNIVMTSHSPFIISDIPKHDIIFLRNGKNGSEIQKNLNEHKQTFGANIHSLLSDSFFLQDGLMGDFANKKISDLIDFILDNKWEKVLEKKDEVEKLIYTVGEEVIKIKLLDTLENQRRSNILDLGE